MSSSIFALIKFGRKEHLQQFRTLGLLYMKSLADFRDLESDAARGDPFEGCDTIIQSKDAGELTLTIPALGKFTASQSDFVRIRIGRDRTASCNVYCMFAITRPMDGGFDARLFGFPDTDSLIAVLNPSEFIRRVSLAANEEKLAGRYGLVSYYDPDTYSGEAGVFHKPSTFAYQQEFRFAIWPGSAQPKLVSTGSLVDITSEIVPFTEANNRFDFSTRSAQEAMLSW